MLSTTIIWIPKAIYEQNCREANARFPVETGGAFMGYWANNQVVITASIEAGPNATHRRYSFEPDYEWQHAQITKHYNGSGRLETYLGDWHSHPDGLSGNLSWQDKQALRRVAMTPAARAPNPISIIFYGEPDHWSTSAWCAKIVPRKIIWSSLDASKVDLNFY